MSSMHRIAAEIALEMTDFPTVADVIAGRVHPEGEIAIIGLRDGELFRAMCSADEVDWTRLLPTDRVDLVGGPLPPHLMAPSGGEE